jgi:hypothetical protein
MIEQALLDRVVARLGGLNLAPAPVLVGVIEPAIAADLPAVVLAIESATRPSNGLGERSAVITNGALAWTADIDLANPVLADDPSFSLVSADRTQLTLPHGGLVRNDGSTGPLRASDIQLSVQENAQTLVAAAPGPSQFTADPLVGTLTLGQALPASGHVVAQYFLGQWEQRSLNSNGVLRLSVLASDPSTVRDLSNSVLAGLVEGPTTSANGVLRLQVTEIDSVGPADPPLAPARRRVMRLQFDFQQEINIPESSGGIIQRIPVQAGVS